MTPTQRVKAAKALLANLLRLQVVVKDDFGDGENVEAPVFSETSLYNLMGKDNARSVRGHLRVLAKTLGINNMDLVATGREEVVEPTDNRMRLWAVEDGIGQAASAIRMLRFAVQDLDASREFDEAVRGARAEVEQAVSSSKYSTPKRVLQRVIKALGISPKTGRLQR